MKTWGYCVECRLYRMVRVAPHDLWKLQAFWMTPEGVCDDCWEGSR